MNGASAMLVDVNPSDTRDVVGECPEASAQEGAQVLAAAREAFPAWGATTPSPRAERLTRDMPGRTKAPALFTDSQPSMRINREETFRPVATILRVRDAEEALAVANDTEFGLSAGICTTSLRWATHFRRHAQAELVMVNPPTAGLDHHLPFGGRKASS